MILDTPKDQVPCHLSLTKDEKDIENVHRVLGNRSYDWILKIMILSANFAPIIDAAQYEQDKQQTLRYRLKLIVILVNQVITQIVSDSQKIGIRIIEDVYSVCEGHPIKYEFPSEKFFLHNLLIELIAAYRHYIDENIKNKSLKVVSINAI